MAPWHRLLPLAPSITTADVPVARATTSAPAPHQRRQQQDQQHHNREQQSVISTAFCVPSGFACNSKHLNDSAPDIQTADPIDDSGPLVAPVGSVLRCGCARPFHPGTTYKVVSAAASSLPRHGSPSSPPSPSSTFWTTTSRSLSSRPTSPVTISSRAESPACFSRAVDSPIYDSRAFTYRRRSVVSMTTLLPLSLATATASSSPSSSSSSATTPTTSASASKIRSTATPPISASPSKMASVVASKPAPAVASAAVGISPTISGLQSNQKSATSHTTFHTRPRLETRREQPQTSRSDFSSRPTTTIVESSDVGSDSEEESTWADPVVADFDFCNLPEMLARDLELSSALFASRNLSAGLPMSRLAAERFEAKGRPLIPALVLRNSTGSVLRDSATFGARSDNIGSPSISSPSRPQTIPSPLTKRGDAALDDTTSDSSRSEEKGDRLSVHQSTATKATPTVPEQCAADPQAAPVSPGRSIWIIDSDGAVSEPGSPGKPPTIPRRAESRRGRQPNTTETRPQQRSKSAAPSITTLVPSPGIHSNFVINNGNGGSAAVETVSRPTSMAEGRRLLQQDIEAFIPKRRSSLTHRASMGDLPNHGGRNMISPLCDPEDAMISPSLSRSTRAASASRASSVRATSRPPSVHVSKPSIQTTAARKPPPPALVLKPLPPKSFEGRRGRRNHRDQQITPREEREWDARSSESVLTPLRPSSISSRIASPAKPALLPTPRVNTSFQTWLSTSMTPHHKRNLSDEYPGLRPGGMPLPPDVLDTLRVSVSCFPETMLLTNSLSVETLRSYSRKVKRPSVQPRLQSENVKPMANETQSTSGSSSQASSKRWNWTRILSSSNKKGQQDPPLSRLGSDSVLDPENVEGEERPPWMALKNVFAAEASDYLCDALYAHVIAYNYITAVCSRLTPAAQSTHHPATTSSYKSHADLRHRRTPSLSQKTLPEKSLDIGDVDDVCYFGKDTVEELDEKDEGDEDGEGEDDDDDGDDDDDDVYDDKDGRDSIATDTDKSSSNEIPRKAASLLGFGEPSSDLLAPRLLGARGVGRKSSIAVLREAMAANSSQRSREGERDRLTEVAVRALHAGLGRCIARLAAALRSPGSENVQDQLQAEGPLEVDVLFLRSLCEIVRCCEETQS